MAGTQLGLGLMMLVLVVGLSSIIATMGVWFDWLRLLGAAYLIWLGWKLLRSSGGFDQPAGAPPPRGGFFLQGFLVLIGNPKALLWFGAFIPQFVDPRGDYVGQVVLLGLTAMATAAISDGAYAVLAGGARSVLSRSRVRLVSRIGGLCLIGGGAWLALTTGAVKGPLRGPSGSGYCVACRVSEVNPCPIPCFRASASTIPRSSIGRR